MFLNDFAYNLFDYEFLLLRIVINLVFIGYDL